MSFVNSRFKVDGVVLRDTWMHWLARKIFEFIKI